MSAIHPHVPFPAAHRTLVLVLAVGLVLAAAALTAVLLLTTGDPAPAAPAVVDTGSSVDADVPAGPIDTCYGAGAGTPC